MRNILLSLFALLASGYTLYAQTTKSYTGAYRVGDSDGTATYQYTEDAATGSRVFNGRFSYTGKVGDVLIETVEGNYKDDLKNGSWVYNSKTVPGLRTVSDQKFSGSYKNGYPDGTWILNSVTKFVAGTQHAGKSLTGTSITITGTANYKNSHLFGTFKFDNKQTGDNVQPVSVYGAFDENGLMDGKWTIKWAKQINGQIWEQTREYKNGILVSIRELDPQSGQATNEEYADRLSILTGYDALSGLFVSSDNQVYIADTLGAEGNWGADYALSVASDFFCKSADEDHYHHNTKGCEGCSYFKILSFKKLNNNQIADKYVNNKEYEKAARMYELFIKAHPESAILNYSNLAWINCLRGNFEENIAICNEGIKLANGGDSKSLIKNLANSYLMTGNYEEGKAKYYEYMGNDLNALKELVEMNRNTLSSAGFSSPNFDKLLDGVSNEIVEREKIEREREIENKRKQEQEELERKQKGEADRIERERKAELERLEQQRKQEVKQLQSDIPQRHESFLKLYTGQKEIGFLVDANGNPVNKSTYPKGKNLYNKSEALFQHYLNQFNTETTDEGKITSGNNILKYLNKLLELSDDEVKRLDKELKKIEDVNEIERILGVK
jgi:hypothetical protein